MIYLTADLHFYHENIIKLEGRPFDSVEEMNEILIKRWNSYIKKNDEMYILGDLTLGSKKDNLELFKQLKGKKYLIVGNHDRVTPQWYEHFEWIKDYHILRCNKQKYILFHYPIYSWKGKDKGYRHLHGHTHDGSHPDFDHPLKYNVGLGVNNYFPIALEDVEERIQERLYNETIKIENQPCQ